ncbi:MAG: hypothetical protein ACM3XM_09455 [Mycobacterium leprae]
MKKALALVLVLISMALLAGVSAAQVTDIGGLRVASNRHLGR